LVVCVMLCVVGFVVSYVCLCVFVVLCGCVFLLCILCVLRGVCVVCV